MKRRTLSSKARQLASIAAAGVSAIAVTGAKAEASVISSPILNTTIGFSSNTFVPALVTGSRAVASMHTFKTFVGQNGPSIRLVASSVFSPFASGDFRRYVRGVTSPAHSTFLGLTHAFDLHAFSAGEKWNSASDTGGFDVPIALRAWSTGSGEPCFFFCKSFTDEYFLFTFQGSSGTQYGWIEMSAAVQTVNNSPSAAYGPDVTVVQYAFDNSGALIGAGETAGETPEPSSIAECGLAALILGAEGLRRWRKALRA